MHWALNTLGVGPDADERAIKRAYAAKLKTTRPETDPQGFQALNEAYRSALAWRSARDAEAFDDVDARDADEEQPARPAAVEADSDRAADGTSSPETTPDAVSPPAIEASREAPAASSDDAADSEGEPFDVERFFDDCFAAARDGDPRVIDRWLNAQPILWSLQHKATIGHWLLRAMHERTPPMPDRSFDRIAQFFGYHELHGGYDPLALQGLRVRVDEAWRWPRQASQQPPGSGHAPDQGSPQGTHPSAPPQDRRTRNPAEIEQERREAAYMHRLLRLHRHLVEKPSLLRDLRLGLNLKHAASVREIVFDNPYGDIDALPDRIRRDQIAFWLAAEDDRRLSRPRLLIALVRCLALALPIFPLMLVLLMQEAPEAGLTATILFKAVIYPFTALVLAWLFLATLKWLVYWQADPAPTSNRLKWAHTLAVPALTMASIATLLSEGKQAWSCVIGIVAVWTAYARWRQRKPGAGKLSKATPFLTMMFLSLLTVPYAFQDKPPWIAFFALASLALWGHGLIRRRRER
jgi:hypothetical protein